jgi:hypothetical protein
MKCRRRDDNDLVISQSKVRPILFNLRSNHIYFMTLSDGRPTQRCYLNKSITNKRPSLTPKWTF